MKSHMGQEPSQHVMLVNREAKKPGDAVCGSGAFAGQALYQVAPTGAESASPYAVPKGKVLFITDVEWYAVMNSTKTGTRMMHLTIAVGGTHVFASRPVTFDFERKGLPGGSEQLTSGFQVRENVTICPALRYLGGPASDTAPDLDAISKFSLFLLCYLVNIDK